MKLHSSLVPSPLGPIRIAVRDDGALVELEFDGTTPATAVPAAVGVVAPPLARAVEAVADYFRGGRALFDLPVAPVGTGFQLQVWEELRRIRYGATISYAELARRIGAPRGVRAVAQANARNRIAIAIPCHRVIGADGSLTGYAAGTARKRALLELEGALLRLAPA